MKTLLVTVLTHMVFMMALADLSQASTVTAIAPGDKLVTNSRIDFEVGDHWMSGTEYGYFAQQGPCISSGQSQTCAESVALWRFDSTERGHLAPGTILTVVKVGPFKPSTEKIGNQKVKMGLLNITLESPTGRTFYIYSLSMVKLGQKLNPMPLDTFQTLIAPHFEKVVFKEGEQF